MTFSIAGRCRRSGMLGVAVTTSSICVGARCPWVRARVGAVSTQNVTLPSIGPDVLDRLARGMSAQQALEDVLSRERFTDYRQVTVVDGSGGIAHFSGSNTLGVHAIASGDGCVAGGNLLSDPDVPAAMVCAFESAPEAHLAERLLRSLEAGIAAGGEMGAVHSAALLVADDQPWPVVDLRIDWDEEAPVRSLRSLWTAYEPQMNDYVTRALDPPSAPSYGVPGDD